MRFLFLNFSDISFLANRCLGAAAKAVTEAVEVVVAANTTAIPSGGLPPQGPSSSTPSWM